MVHHRFIKWSIKYCSFSHLLHKISSKVRGVVKKFWAWRRWTQDSWL